MEVNLISSLEFSYYLQDLARIRRLSICVVFLIIALAYSTFEQCAWIAKYYDNAPQVFQYKDHQWQLPR